MKKQKKVRKSVFKKFIFCTGYIIVFLLFSCANDKKIFQVSSPENILQIADSINKTPIDSTKKLPLTFYEKMNSYYFYRKVATVYENKHFKIIILISQKREEKFYHILARTISKFDDKVIGTFLVASYDHNSKEFCSGFINNDLKVSRTCDAIKFTLEKQIDEFGNITPVH